MSQAQKTSQDAVSGLQPLSYLNSNQPANVLRVIQNRAPTSSDRRYKIGTIWFDTSSDQVYGLVKVVANAATWTVLGPGASDVDTLTGDTGGAISPTGGNINILGGDNLTVAGSGSTLTINLDSDAYPVTPFVVGSSGDAGYQTIQAALDAANTAGGGVVFIQPGTYSENLTLYDNVDLYGLSFSTVTITGVHTPPTSGDVTFQNLTLTSATSILSSSAAGTANINIEQCESTVTNGFVFDLANWSGGTLLIDDCFSGGTNNGVVNNTGGADVKITDATVGAGSGQTFTYAGGTGTLEGVVLNASSTFGASTTLVARLGTVFGADLTLTNDATATIEDCIFNSGADAAITMSSSGAVTLSNSIIDSSNNPAIDGAGAGTLTIENVSFLDNSDIASALTLARGTTVNGTIKATTFDTDVAAAGVTLTGTTLSADGTDANIGITVTPKGTGTLALANGTAGNNVTMGNGINTVAQTVSISNGAAAADSTVNILSGNASAGTQTLNLGQGTGGKTINVGTDAGANAITIGSTNTTSSLDLQVGTGNFTLDGAATSTYTIGAATTSGTISIGGTAQTGTMTIAGGNGAQQIDIADSTGGKTVNIATGAGANAVSVGSTNTTSATTINSGSGGVTLTGDVTVSTGDLAVTRTEVAGEVTSQVTNSDNTDPSSDSFLEAAVGGTSGGNPGIRFQISGGQNYSMGIDNASANDDLLICGDNDIGTDPLVTIAEAGDVTVNKGNLVLDASATQLQVKGGAATDFIGTATLSSGAVTVANTNIAATDRIFIQRQASNGSTNLGSLSYSITASTSFTITSLQDASPGNTQTGDNSIVMYFIVRQTA